MVGWVFMPCSAAMIKICDQSIYVAFLKDAWKQACTPPCGKKLMLFLYVKRGVGKINVYISQYPSFNFLERFLKNSYLMSIYCHLCKNDLISPH